MGCIKIFVTSTWREVILPSLHLSGVLHPALALPPASPQNKKDTCWSKSKGGPQTWSEGWSTSLMRTGWASWGCSPWRRFLGDLIEAFQYLKSGYKRAGEQLFITTCCKWMRNDGFKWKEKLFRGDIGKKFLSMSVMRLEQVFQRCYGSLEVLKASLDGALSNLV